MPSTKIAVQNISTLTETERRKLAGSIFAARDKNQPWDGENGIVNDDRFPLIKSAGQGRKLLREIGKTDAIMPSYDRAAKGLVGPRVAVEAPKPKRVRKPASK